ncbi:head-tail joining protein [Tranquillimonas rosea]|uniref:head-tail joining protein n=1 Tax=Tranquillimonas rosea TaxID=641238 RepID=UPI003BA97EEE
MDAIARGMDAVFTDPNMAESATYTPAGGGESATVRVILRRPDVVSDFNRGQFVSDTTEFDIRVSDAPELRAGDTIDLGDETLTVVGEPRRDPRRLKWTAEARA